MYTVRICKCYFKIHILCTQIDTFRSLSPQMGTPVQPPSYHVGMATVWRCHGHWATRSDHGHVEDIMDIIPLLRSHGCRARMLRPAAVGDASVVLQWVSVDETTSVAEDMDDNNK